MVPIRLSRWHAATASDSPRLRRLVSSAAFLLTGLGVNGATSGLLYWFAVRQLPPDGASEYLARGHWFSFGVGFAILLIMWAVHLAVVLVLPAEWSRSTRRGALVSAASGALSFLLLFGLAALTSVLGIRVDSTDPLVLAVLGVPLLVSLGVCRVFGGWTTHEK